MRDLSHDFAYCRFADAADPDYEGHLLLEQAHAQLLSALRPCFAALAPPLLAAAGCALLARYLRAIARSSSAPLNGQTLHAPALSRTVDAVAVRKLLSLLLEGPLAAQDTLVPFGHPSANGTAAHYPALSESAAALVMLSALTAAADLQRAAAREPSMHTELITALRPALPRLRTAWLALLRDWCVLETQPKGAWRAYRPFFWPAPATAPPKRQLALAAPAAFEALVGMVGSDAWVEGRPVDGPPPPQLDVDAVDESLPPPLVAGAAADDFSTLLGVCTCQLGNFAGMLPGGDEVGRLDEDEALRAAEALQSLLAPSQLSAVSAESLMLVLHLAAEIAVADGVSHRLCAALGRLTVQLSGTSLSAYADALSYRSSAAALEDILSAGQRLGAAPLLRQLPQLRSLQGPAVTVAPITPEEAPLIVLGVRALAALPQALPAAAALPGAKLTAWAPAALLAALHAAAAACAAELPLLPHAVAVGDAALTAVTTALSLVEEAEGKQSGSWGGGLSNSPEKGLSDSPALTLRCAAAETVLALFATTGPLRQRHLLSLLLSLVEGIPLAAAAAILHCRAQEAIRALLTAATAATALAALQSFIVANALPRKPLALAYLTALLPSTAPLLCRDHSWATVADKTATLKLLLLGITLVPSVATLPLLSLGLPLLAGCLVTAADHIDPPLIKLSALAATSISALAKRHTDEFRCAVSELSPTMRTKMEASLRETVAATQQTAASLLGAHITVAAAPKIALRMDFSCFGAN